MCTRYSISNRDAIRELAACIAPGNRINEIDDWSPIYNVFPTSDVPVLTTSSDQPLQLIQWGTKVPTGFRVNVQAEKIGLEPMLLDAVQHRRCLILADGFFEWSVDDRKKVGHYFSLPRHHAFAIAALWLPATDSHPDRCVMVTNAPNEIVAPFNDQMPSILTNESAMEWLGDQPLPSGLVTSLCTPYPAAEMTEWRSPPELIQIGFDEPAAIQPWQPVALFSFA